MRLFCMFNFWDSALVVKIGIFWSCGGKHLFKKELKSPRLPTREGPLESRSSHWMLFFCGLRMTILNEHLEAVALELGLEKPNSSK